MAVSPQNVLAKLDRFIRNVGSDLDELGYEIKTSVVTEIVRAGAIDTTAMIQAVDYHRSPVTDSGYHMRIDTSKNPDVFYDGFVEFDTRNRDGSIRQGRRFNAKGIQNANIHGFFDNVANRSFVI